jgi:hypothetical protein
MLRQFDESEVGTRRQRAGYVYADGARKLSPHDESLSSYSHPVANQPSRTKSLVNGNFGGKVILRAQQNVAGQRAARIRPTSEKLDASLRLS